MLIERIKFLLFVSAIGFLATGKLLAQNNPNMPTIIPPSPEAAALFKFTDIPVSPYTGATEINVPIYTIQAKGVSLPVSVNYHTGGIRIKEESGLVGLGWALNAGGNISRTVMDKDDFNASDYFTTNVPQPQGDLSYSQPQIGSHIYSDNNYTPNLGNYIFDLFCNDLVNFSTGMTDYTPAFGTSGPSAYDMEPDIYTYSFAGKSGKFIITRNRQVILQKQDNIRIQFENNGNSFTITDENGNVFYFSDKAYVQSASVISSPISSWNLSKIITQQKDSILFTYYVNPTPEYVAPDITEVQTVFSSGSDGHQVLNGAGTFYGNKLLQKIDFNAGQLQFYYDNNRSDLQGGAKLDSVRIFSKDASGLKYHKSFQFFYTYFNNSLVVSDSLETKRLRLDSVKEVSGSLSIPPYAFTYNLPGTVGSLAKHGYSVDHWGFFNGQTNTGLIPTQNLYYDPPYFGLFIPPQFYSYSGAFRDPVSNYINAFSLSQVKYPTGGKTVLEYEPNDYDELNSRNGPTGNFYNPTVKINQVSLFSDTRGDNSGTLDLSKIYPAQPPNSAQTNLTILLTFRASDQTGLAHWRGTYGQVQFSFTGKDANITQDISGSNLTCSGPVCTINIPVTVHAGSPMTYNYDFHISPGVGTDYQDTRVTLQYDTVQLAGDPVGNGFNNYAKTGSGLRAKTITDYSDDITIAKKRRFEYNYSQTQASVISYHTYGILISHPNYARYQYFFAEQLNALGLILSSSSLTQLSSAISGNIIGYSQVNEYNVDPVSGQDIGKTVYTYFNSPDSGVDYHGWQFPGIMNMGNSLNGLLLSKTEYANAGSYYKPVDSVAYTYHTTNRSVYFSPKYQPTGHTGNSSSQYCPIGTGVPEVILCFYPSLKSERVLMDAESKTVYDQQIAGNSTTTTTYYYDNPIHYQLTRTHTYDSKGNMLVQSNKYPQDYIPSGGSVTGNTLLDSLIGRNMVSEVIEQCDSLYHSGTTAGIVTGGQLNTFRRLPNNTYNQDKSYRLDLSYPANDFQPFTVSNNTTTQDSRYRQMVSFDRYDPSGNMAQYTGFNQGPVSVLWDYLHSYPVAQVKNADSSSIAYTSFEADGSGNWIIGPGTLSTSGGITGNNYYTLTSGSTITKSGLMASRNYVVTYWAKNPLTISGTTAVPGLVKNGWKFYQHNLPAGTTAVSISGDGIGLDELRLYPADAQMTTYTYSPLTGQTSSCSANNSITYCEYDALGRLKDIKDPDGNIIKTYDYHYKQP